MKFLDLVNTRQSNRKYLDKPVEREKLERCLEAARLAPSASNSQPCAFHVIDDPELRNKLALTTSDYFTKSNNFIKTAPVVIAVVLQKTSLKLRLAETILRKPYSLIDLGIAAEHFCLQAAEEGLGTCMIGWFHGNAVARVLQIPRGSRIELLITVGYPGDAPRSKIRKSIDDFRKYNLETTGETK